MIGCISELSKAHIVFINQSSEHTESLAEVWRYSREAAGTFLRDHLQ